MGGIRLTLRVDFGPDRAIGPGKVLLLEAIRDTGSISQAGRSLDVLERSDKPNADVFGVTEKEA